ncbi:PLP-dependent aminotransferase family protein [Xanthomonas sp. A2111]|uniref:PLP-dependent aminotransferase family protein n=1 Tax=Xanthomonas hawaiiensis TaxID=3003247 RepID=A0ABU2IAI0_9XANT|nr:MULTISPECIES: PLP-dependent aminotransferase family protein [unclassified Xanthomonas]MBO9830633.1 PLP-dependent aminotransferase family protein [Xanthomonas sp. A2111]MBO9874434.1 PLP-dependent aminotransferase family protein [Xanthomonas sp. D-93]MDS9995156.1 PLP-dependent aminotransferase family protein [Xanthomonas sp. A2111]WNH46798.1 PLP-dependent aminotransferase family protein [Xanthomonas sp. A6251]
MNFLNEVAERYPRAISLAAGRPAEVLFERLSSTDLTNRIDLYLAASNTSMNQLLQYGRTAGVINALMAEQLCADDGILATADRIVVTSGCQEAMSLCLSALSHSRKDVILACNPTYIGATGAAAALGISVHGLNTDGDGIPAAIEKAVAELHADGRRARAFYVIPNFDNPTGRVLNTKQRVAILEACERHRIVVLEDNAYGMFRYDGAHVPPLAALDRAGLVIYLSTYSKTLCPAVRIGSAVLPETLFGDRDARIRLCEDIVRRKSYLTVNTGQINQAIVGGHLLQEGGSLRRWIEPVRTLYHANRDLMLTSLQARFCDRGDISWNSPEGGFFLTVDLPFVFDADAVAECANNEGVIVMPMSFFAIDRSQDCRIRLAFSAIRTERIADGIESLARYINFRLHGTAPKLALRAKST